jgi:glycosyltransferase involved in cell wall biosynthesis
MLKRAQESILAPSIAGMRVIPNGVDLTTFRPDGEAAPRPEPGIPRLMFAANGGAANPHKDFAAIRASVERLGGPVELVSVGGEQGTEELGRGIRIRHEPHQEPETLATLYRSADVYVHASAEESFSLTAAEALACGTPVVAASAGGITEVVDDERTGLIVSPADRDALAASLRRVLADPQMGDAAVADRGRFDRDRMVRDMHALCGEAMQAWRP